jgi:hypothetical protein
MLGGVNQIRVLILIFIVVVSFFGNFVFVSLESVR